MFSCAVILLYSGISTARQCTYCNAIASYTFQCKIIIKNVRSFTYIAIKSYAGIEISQSIADIVQVKKLSFNVMLH
jgi:hypothetical protein